MTRILALALLVACSPTEGDDTDDTDTGVVTCAGWSDDSTTWTLPSRGDPSDPVRWDWPDAHGTYHCSADAIADVSWTRTRMNDDAIPDLVVLYDECDAQIASSRWEVFYGTSTGFTSTPSIWRLPPNPGDPPLWLNLDDVAGIDCEGDLGGAIAWYTLDVAGDGWADLLLTHNICDPESGRTRWDLYAGGPEGFAEQPTAWALPQRIPGMRWPLLGTVEAITCDSGGSGVIVTSSRDMTGDGRLDFVVLSDTCTAGVGVSQWDVYPGEAGGFAQSPTAWNVPVRGNAADPVRWGSTTDSEYACEGGGTGRLEWALGDMTGDGRLDLVVLEDSCDPDMDESYWEFYAAGASGFASTPSRWSLPRRAADGDLQSWRFFGAGSDLVTCDGGGDGILNHEMVNVTGDDRPDLIVYEDTCSPDTARWDVYVGTATGFAANPLNWRLPQLGASEDLFEWTLPSFDDPEAYACESGAGSAVWSLLDLWGGGASVPVFYEDTCDPGVGTTRWKAFATPCEPP